MISVNTEMSVKGAAHGTLFYDDRCPRCRAAARVLARALARRGFAVRPLALASPGERSGVPDAAWYAQMQLVSRSGQRFAGADAAIELARYFWWSRPGHWLGRLPVIRRWLARLYGELARRRYCVGHLCGEVATTLKPKAPGMRSRHGTASFFRMP